MNINIFGSTGVIGKKTLELIETNFPNLKINLLCAKSNINLLKKQIKQYKPKYAFLYDLDKFSKINTKIGKTKLLNFNELQSYLISSKSNLSLLAISGYKSLYFLENIINNTDNLGIVSKEAVVSAGHIFKKNKYFSKTNIFPIDSEHFSLFELFNKIGSNITTKKVILTASGGPFYKKKFKTLNNITFSQAIRHPKWKMGYKNSIDSATLVNKCLELIEAHYLFDIPFNKMDILIHPQALVHSIVEFNNYTTQLNLFKNDMKIPILNFLLSTESNYLQTNNNLFLKNYTNLNFENVNNNIFPIYKYFKKIDKKVPQNIIKFNIGNEFAVNLFKNNKIKYTDIYKIIKKVTSIKLYSSVNTIKDIISYHEDIENILQKSKNNFN
ncbi:hypothetical protein OA977_00015 [Pelagibacteraceae bacterium]|nr:hypothetical protein [Pelagibacteraceae bacterium]